MSKDLNISLKSLNTFPWIVYWNETGRNEFQYYLILFYSKGYILLKKKKTSIFDKDIYVSVRLIYGFRKFTLVSETISIFVVKNMSFGQYAQSN